MASYRFWHDEVVETWKPIGGLASLWRGGFWVDYGGSRWTVGLNYFDFDEKIHLYRDGALVDTQSSPASFDIGDEAVIEAKLALYGMAYVRLDSPAGKRQLEPVAGTGEKWRADLALKRPGVSRLLATAAVLVILFGVVTQVPVLVNVLLEVFDGFGGPVPSWRAPTLELAGWANVTITVVAVLAALERALSMRHISGFDD